MKKILVLVLALVMSGVVCSCSSGTSSENGEKQKSSDNSTDVKQENVSNQDNDSLDTETSKEQEKQEIASQETQFVASSDLKVSFAYIYSNDTFIVVENTSDKAIIDYSVAYVSFDKNGLPTDSSGYESGNVSAANILPGEKSIRSFFGATGDYVIATVSKIKFQGGEEWQAENLEEWAEKTKAEFTVDSYKQSIKNLSEQAKLAETNEYMTIISTDKRHENQFSNQDDFVFSLENISDKDIIHATLKVLEYDENGYAVSTSPYSTYVKNDNSAGGSVNLTSGDRKLFTSSLFFEGDCSKYKCAIATIEFADGTEWENPYIYEWIIVNCDEYID